MSLPVTDLCDICGRAPCLQHMSLLRDVHRPNATNVEAALAYAQSVAVGADDGAARKASDALRCSVRATEAA